MSVNLEKNSIKGVLLDITGVLYESGDGYGQVIPGSVEALERLKQEAIPFRLVTNETTTSREVLVNKLLHHGFDVGVSDVISPIPAIISILKQKNQVPHLLVHPDVMCEFKCFAGLNPNCVVIGDADHNFSFANVNAAFNALKAMDESILYSLGKGKYYRHEGELKLDVGAFTTALEFACDIQATVVGKPAKEFFTAALDDISVKPEERADRRIEVLGTEIIQN